MNAVSSSRPTTSLVHHSGLRTLTGRTRPRRRGTFVRYIASVGNYRRHEDQDLRLVQRLEEPQH